MGLFLKRIYVKIKFIKAVAMEQVNLMMFGLNKQKELKIIKNDSRRFKCTKY